MAPLCPARLVGHACKETYARVDQGSPSESNAICIFPQIQENLEEMMPRTFLRDSNGELPEQDDDDTVCVTVKDKNGEVMHFMLRKGARLKPPAPEPQKPDAE